MAMMYTSDKTYLYVLAGKLADAYDTSTVKISGDSDIIRYNTNVRIEYKTEDNTQSCEEKILPPIPELYYDGAKYQGQLDRYTQQQNALVSAAVTADGHILAVPLTSELNAFPDYLEAQRQLHEGSLDKVMEIIIVLVEKTDGSFHVIKCGDKSMVQRTTNQQVFEPLPISINEKNFGFSSIEDFKLQVGNSYKHDTDLEFIGIFRVKGNALTSNNDFHGVGSRVAPLNTEDITTVSQEIDLFGIKFTALFYASTKIYDAITKLPKGFANYYETAINYKLALSGFLNRFNFTV